MTPLIWLYNSHLFKCAIRHRSVSQWAGGICFRASCRASKRSSGSVSSDTNKTTRSNTLIGLDTSAVWLSNRSAGSKTSGYYMSSFIIGLLHLRSVWVFFNPVPKFGTISKFKTLNKHETFIYNNMFKKKVLAILPLAHHTDTQMEDSCCSVCTA